jgi:hypothetical protein
MKMDPEHFPEVACSSKKLGVGPPPKAYPVKYTTRKFYLGIH